jgi:hypothetical protein
VVQQFEHIEPLSFEGYFNFRTENERGVLKWMVANIPRI